VAWSIDRKVSAFDPTLMWPSLSSPIGQRAGDPMADRPHNAVLCLAIALTAVASARILSAAPDQINGGYDCIKACVLGRHRLDLVLSKPIGRHKDMDGKRSRREASMTIPNLRCAPAGSRRGGSRLPIGGAITC